MNPKKNLPNSAKQKQPQLISRGSSAKGKKISPLVGNRPSSTINTTKPQPVVQNNSQNSNPKSGSLINHSRRRNLSKSNASNNFLQSNIIIIFWFKY